MKPRYIVTVVLFVVALTLVARNSGSGSGRRGESLTYKDSLDLVAAEVNGSKLTLRDLAFYVAYEEALVEEQAEIYDSENPKKYWQARVEGGFVWVVARNAMMDMAIHDEVFYQMAVDEGLELTASEKEQANLTLEDFWADLTDRGGEQMIGVTKEEFAETVDRITLAQKYQGIYAAMQEKSYEDYDFTADDYAALLEKQDYTVYDTVWRKVGVGNVTLTFDEK
jgi:hypothetical protein